MKVYDCILFSNEFDLLELRLKTLWDVVDYFVIVEAPWTFSGNPKPLHFRDRHREFQHYLHKIRHVQLDGFLEAETAWHREFASRDAMVEGFHDAEPDDLIFQSDADEIWRPEKRDEFLDREPIMVFEQRMFYYTLNSERVPRINWYGTRRLRRKHWTMGQAVRAIKRPGIPGAGWHFSFLGDEHAAALKMKSFSHTEYSGDEWTDTNRIRQAMDSGVDLINPIASYVPVPVDETFPRPVLEEPQRWAKFIKSPQA